MYPITLSKKSQGVGWAQILLFQYPSPWCRRRLPEESILELLPIAVVGDLQNAQCTPIGFPRNFVPCKELIASCAWTCLSNSIKAYPLTRPVFLSIFKWMDFSLPYSEKISDRSSSWASSCTPVTNTTHPSILCKGPATGGGGGISSWSSSCTAFRLGAYSLLLLEGKALCGDPETFESRVWWYEAMMLFDASLRRRKEGTGFFAEDIFVGSRWGYRTVTTTRAVLRSSSVWLAPFDETEPRCWFAFVMVVDVM